MTNTETATIAALNDRCRKAMGIAGRVVQTSGISALSPQDQSRIREKVEMFDDFTPDNDPHGERDFGAFDHDGARVFWKIDYYDKTITQGSGPRRPASNRESANHHACVGILGMRGRCKIQPHWTGPAHDRAQTDRLSGGIESP
jgi:hypothetical protein